MDRAMPDDVPIESKMVTKSVERAQTTVEQRNAETRKNVLKYDEVFNQQRKIIYQRRLQLMDQGDLRDETIEAIGTTAEGLVSTHCQDDLDDTWDLDGLITDARQFWPTELTPSDLVSCRSLAELAERLSDDAVDVFEKREAELGADVMRQVENQIMLQLIDQRWREHLTEMDQLRQGIGLRAMGQRDPLTEFQREGFDMFSAMMTALESDYVRYVMHVQVVQPAPVATQEVPEESKAPEETAQVGDVAAKGLNAPVPTAVDVHAEKADVDAPSASARPEAAAPRANRPKVNDEWDSTGRNEPCPCGSGKKFKKCHGAA